MLYGRQVERIAILALLDRARTSSGSGALVLRGEAGLGKSALLADAVDRADGMQVVRAVGVQSESELAFAGLHQIVRPLLGELDEIPAPQASALRGALGLEPAVEQDRFLIAAALLSVLAAAAEHRALLCVVDDAQWLDTPSAGALTFAARRLQAEPVALLFGVREGEEKRFDAPDLPDLVLSPLDHEASSALLAERCASALAPDVRDRILAGAAGNPLALLELPLALSPSQLAGQEPLVDPLPLTGSIEDTFLARARRLPESSQLLLLLAAADDTGDAAIVFDAARSLGIDGDAFTAAESGRLLRVADGRVEFRHPLVRSAIYQSASFAQRQTIHRVLAEALSDERYADRRAWHRAAATVGADEEIARQLEESAERSRRRSGYAAASAALERSAALTPDDATRARRLAAAAEAAWFAGRAGQAKTLLEESRRTTSDPILEADIDQLRALIEVQTGAPAKGHEILSAAYGRVTGLDPCRAAALLVSSGEAAAFAGLTDRESEAGRRAGELQRELPERRFELTMMMGIRNLLEGDAAEAVPLLRESIALGEASANPRRWFWIGSSALYLLEFDTARAAFGRAADEARAAGAVTMLAIALQMLAHGETLEGRFASASANATEALQLELATGQENGACHLRAVLAWAAGAGGREEECRALASEVFVLATPRGLGLQAAYARRALAELELGLGRPAAALTHFEGLQNAGPGGTHPALALLATPSLIEAAVQVDRLDLVEAVFPAYEHWVTNGGSRYELPLLARARGLLAGGTASFEYFEEALRLHAEVQRPFERGRTEFVYGEALRRARQRRGAREHLRRALELFEQVGAAGWAERARIELRATGETARKRDPSTVDQLTAQELQIARFVAAGATNKEVAAQLFLSPRTIEFHLRNIFGKLGITSRVQLGRLIDVEEQAASAIA